MSTKQWRSRSLFFFPKLIWVWGLGFFQVYGKEIGQLFHDEPSILPFKSVLFIGTDFYNKYYFLISIHEDILNHCVCLLTLLPFWFQPSPSVCPERSVTVSVQKLLCCNMQQVLFKEKESRRNIHPIYFSYLFILLQMLWRALEVPMSSQHPSVNTGNFCS